MELFVLGVLIVFVSLFTEIDDILFGIPIAMMTGVGFVFYGALSHLTDFTNITNIISSIVAGLFIGIAYRQALSITSNDLNS